MRRLRPGPRVAESLPGEDARDNAPGRLDGGEIRRLGNSPSPRLFVTIADRGLMGGRG